MLLVDYRHMHKNINICSINEMMYIFQIIVIHNESYTRNSNGIFFDLNQISEKTLKKIKEYIDIVVKNKKF